MKNADQRRKYRVALVGVGKMGRNHLRVLNQHDGFEVIAIVDPVEATQDLKTETTAWYDSVDAFLRTKPQLDFVVVAANTKEHFALVSRLLSLRVPLLVEKPIAKTFQESQQLIGLANDAKVRLFVGHTERSNPAVRKLRDVIDSGILGTPIHFSATRVGGFPQERKDTNVLLDLAVHDLDVISLLTGPLKLRSSICHHTLDHDFCDTAQLLLTNDNGTSAAVHVNWITPAKVRTLRVTGSKGVARVDYILQTCKVVGGDLIKRTPRTEFTFNDVIQDYINTDQIDFGVNKREPLLVQADEIYNFLSVGSCQLCTAEEGSRVVNLAEMAISAGQGGINAT